MNIRFHVEAINDAIDIEEWYYRISPRRAESFKSELYSALDGLIEMPERWPIIDSDLRQITLTQYPYLIYYVILSNTEILITSVKHQKREPNLNRDRL